VSGNELLWVRFYPSGVFHRRHEVGHEVLCGRRMWEKDLSFKRPTSSTARVCKTCLKSLAARIKRRDPLTNEDRKQIRLHLGEEGP